MSAMRLTHHFRVPAPVDQTYAAFSRLERIAPSFPGATVDSADADRFTGALAVKLGPVPLVYAGSGVYLERNPDRHRVVVEARGEDRRGLGSAVAHVTTQLRGRGDHTDVEVVTELELTGKPARFGAGVVSEVSDKLLDQFTSSLTARFADGALPVLADDPEDTVAAESAPDVGTGDDDGSRPAGAARSAGPVFTPEPAGSAFAADPAPRRALEEAPRFGGSALATVRTVGPVAAAVVVVALVAVRALRRR